MALGFDTLSGSPSFSSGAQSGVDLTNVFTSGAFSVGSGSASGGGEVLGKGGLITNPVFLIGAVILGYAFITRKK